MALIMTGDTDLPVAPSRYGIYLMLTSAIFAAQWGDSVTIDSAMAAAPQLSAISTANEDEQA